MEVLGVSAKAWSPSGSLVASRGAVGTQRLHKVCVVKLQQQGISAVSRLGALEKRERWGKKKGSKVAGIARAAAVAEKVAKVEEITLAPIKTISGKIKLPGSKSLSNRTLLLAALSEVLTFSDWCSS